MDWTDAPPLALVGTSPGDWTHARELVTATAGPLIRETLSRPSPPATACVFVAASLVYIRIPPGPTAKQRGYNPRVPLPAAAFLNNFYPRLTHPIQRQPPRPRPKCPITTSPGLAATLLPPPLRALPSPRTSTSTPSPPALPTATPTPSSTPKPTIPKHSLNGDLPSRTTTTANNAPRPGEAPCP